MESALIAQRLAALRKKLNDAQLDGFLVPQSDVFQNEYISESDCRLKFITGFSGSAGLAIVLMNEAAFFTDCRYTLQATLEVPSDLYACFDPAQRPPTEWLKQRPVESLKIGFDPWLHTAKSIKRWKELSDEKLICFIPVDKNPIDEIWIDRPQCTPRPIVPHPIAYTGETQESKSQRIAETLTNEKIDAAFLSDCASIAWLLNVRGNDIPHTPIPLSFAIIHKSGMIDWFVDNRKITGSLNEHLSPSVTIRPIETLIPFLKDFAASTPRLRVSSDETAFLLVETLEKAGAHLEEGPSPCALPKACKNNIELEGMRSAHRKDGVAMTRFLAWFDAQTEKTSLTEIDIDKKLTSFREQGALYKELSFPTIAGVGANGAVVHYRATEKTNTKLEKDTFLLIDSGAQYLDGTTDITRTLLLGHASPEMCDRYTRVLKGLISLSSARFPEGTQGLELDILARQSLWRVGLTYGHGTGHGVGSYLCVHEGPHGIFKRSTTPLKAGMVISIEPGYYKENHFGIRIENLVAVVSLPAISTPSCPMLGFETLTLAPIDLRPVILQMLLPTEREWLNDYHFKVRETLLPLVSDEKEKEWLLSATEEI